MMAHGFCKSGFKNSAAFWFFELEDARDTQCLLGKKSKDRVAKLKVSFVYSYIWYRAKSSLNTKIQGKPEQQQRNFGYFAQIRL
jgi:hypothetical protein